MCPYTDTHKIKVLVCVVTGDPGQCWLTCTCESELLVKYPAVVPLSD